MKTSKTLFVLSIVFFTLFIIGKTTSVDAQERATKQGIIVPIMDRLDGLAQFYYKKKQEGSHLQDGYWSIQHLISTTQNLKFDVSGSALGEPIPGNAEPVYFGTNTFDNTDSMIDQTYNTTEFSQTVSYAQTTSTNIGFKVNSQDMIQIPISNSEIPGKINLEFNYASTDSNTKTVSNTMTAPRQPIKVPAGKKYKVTVDLRKVPYYGKVSLSAFTTDKVPTFTNTVRTYHYNNWGIPTQREFDLEEIYDTIYFTYPERYNETDLKFESSAKNLFDALIQNAQGTLTSKISFDGEGEYTYEMGTDFIVTTTDITDSEEGQVVNSRNIPLFK